jgi:hypothetical protein
MRADAAAQQIGECRCGAAVRHQGEVGADLPHQLHRAEMTGRAERAHAEGPFQRSRSGGFGQLRLASLRAAWVDGDEHGPLAGARDGPEVRQRVVAGDAHDQPHPTVKPVKLVADAILDCSKRGDVVLDPFLGSGSTLMAAERVGRRCYGVELDAAYVDTIARRWQVMTGRRRFTRRRGRGSKNATIEVDHNAKRGDHHHGA